MGKWLKALAVLMLAAVGVYAQTVDNPVTKKRLESAAFDPNVAGTWDFMSGTLRHYGGTGNPDSLRCASDEQERVLYMQQDTGEVWGCFDHTAGWALVSGGVPGSGDVAAVGTCSGGSCFTSVNANLVLAGPANGAAAAATPRALVSADVPSDCSNANVWCAGKETGAEYSVICNATKTSATSTCAAGSATKAMFDSGLCTTPTSNCVLKIGPGVWDEAVVIDNMIGVTVIAPGATLRPTVALNTDVQGGTFRIGTVTTTANSTTDITVRGLSVENDAYPEPGGGNGIIEAACQIGKEDPGANTGVGWNRITFTDVNCMGNDTGLHVAGSRQATSTLTDPPVFQSFGGQFVGGNTAIQHTSAQNFTDVFPRVIQFTTYSQTTNTAITGAISGTVAAGGSDHEAQLDSAAPAVTGALTTRRIFFYGAGCDASSMNDEDETDNVILGYTSGKLATTLDTVSPTGGTPYAGCSYYIPAVPNSSATGSLRTSFLSPRSTVDWQQIRNLSGAAAHSVTYNAKDDQHAIRIIGSSNTSIHDGVQGRIIGASISSDINESIGSQSAVCTTTTSNSSGSGQGYGVALLFGNWHSIELSGIEATLRANTLTPQLNGGGPDSGGSCPSQGGIIFDALKTEVPVQISGRLKIETPGDAKTDLACVAGNLASGSAQIDHSRLICDFQTMPSSATGRVAQSGGSSKTMKLSASDHQSANDALAGYGIHVTAGDCAGQATMIARYATATDIADITPPFTGGCNIDGDTYTIGYIGDNLSTWLGFVNLEAHVASSLTLGLTSGSATVTTAGTILARTATAASAGILAQDGSDCSAGQYARGIDPNGNATNCTADDDVPDTNEVTGAAISLSSEAAGDVMYFNGTDWVRLAKGTAGQVIEMNALATAPEWDTDDTGGAGLTVEDEDDPLSAETTINFTGTGIECVNGTGQYDCLVDLTPPGGNNTEVQFNASGLFDGDPNFTFTAATGAVFVGGTLTVGGGADGTWGLTAKKNTIDLADPGSGYVIFGAKALVPYFRPNGGSLAELLTVAGSTMTGDLIFGANTYPKIASGTATTGTDCDAAGEAGRLFLDTNDDTDGTVYFCRGAAGWKDIDDDGGAGGSITIEEVDGAPTIAAATKLKFAQADGFTFTDEGSNVGRVNLAAIPIANTAMIAGRSLTLSTNTVDADAELYEQTKCINIDPFAATTSWFLYRFERAAVVTGIDCIVDAATSVVATVQECDANGASCGDTEAAITCAATNTTEASAIDDSAIAAGAYMRVTRGTVTGTPAQLMVCVTYTVAD